MMRGFYVMLVLGNVLFFIRFILTPTGFYEYPLVQSVLIEPGGIYFAWMFLLSAAGILYLEFRLISRFFSTKKTDEKPRFDSLQNASSDPLQSRRAFIKKAGAIAFTAPLILTTGLSLATHRQYIITRQTLYYPGLASGLEGLKLVHISDIHSGIYMNRTQIAEIFELVNGLYPDLILITGDLIDTHISEIPAITSTIDMLNSTYGVYACPGNHDHYASITALESALTSTKVNFLKNDAKILRINGERVSVMGIDDAGNGSRNFADFNKALSLSEKESFRLLLSHRPDMFDIASQQSVDLTLSGHTHGGQIGFNVAGLDVYPIDFFQKYSRGHYQKNSQQLYVNVGVGLVGVPIRLLRPEITLLTLTSDPTKKQVFVENA